MTLFNGLISLKSSNFLIFSVMAIASSGYLIGKISIKGVKLGNAGVFITALLYGILFYDNLSVQMQASFAGTSAKIIETFGLVLFVSAVGFIAGPIFISNLKTNFKSYVILGFVIVLSGALACAACILIGRRATALSNAEFTAMLSGIFVGALTSSPAFSAARAVVDSSLEPLVAVGYGASYLYGVIGVVLFVQIVPKILGSNMEEERQRITAVDSAKKRETKSDLIKIDPFGIMPFSTAAILGMLIGSIKIGNFSLTSTGGCLLVSIVFGHFGSVGRVSLMPSSTTLKDFRELGLILFLIGSGISGGASFIKYMEPVYLLYGIIITTFPMIVGFLLARYVLKIDLLNNLGSITGGMTSTPALGTLINVSGTEAVASAYAATYPVAMIMVVICAQVLIVLFS